MLQKSEYFYSIVPQSIILEINKLIYIYIYIYQLIFCIYLQCINLHENPKLKSALNSHLVHTRNYHTGLRIYTCMKVNLKARNLMKCSEASSEQRTSSEPETDSMSIGDPPSCLQPAKGGHGSRGDRTPRHHSK